jgi:hypothetical protein
MRVARRVASTGVPGVISSGYVRILWELWAAGLADPELAERWRATQRGWRELIEARLERLQTERGIELPMRPRALTALIGNLFEGAETEILAGVPEHETPHLEALEACAALIAVAERSDSSRPAARSRRVAPPRRPSPRRVRRPKRPSA